MTYVNESKYTNIMYILFKFNIVEFQSFTGYFPQFTRMPICKV